jgi:hypothetical protein
MLCLAFLLLLPFCILPLALSGTSSDAVFGYHPPQRVYHYSLCVHPDGRPVQPQQPNPTK